jgi:eukaryotic-like serine/threonine-protein kinase
VPILCVAGEYALARDFIRRFSVGEPAGAGPDGAPQQDIETPGSAAADIARCHYAFFAAGDPWELHGHARAARALGERSGEPRVITMAQAYEGIALVKLGAVDPGVQLLREAREASAARGLRLVGQFADLFLVDALTNRGELDQAIALLRDCQEHAAESALWAAVWSVSAARIARRRGDFDGAVERLREALAVLESLAPGYAAHAFALLGRIELERGGDPARAVALMKQGLGRLDAVGTWCHDIAIRTYGAEVLHAAGDRAAARATLAITVRQIHTRAAAIDDAALRESYLHQVPENARALWLAGAWANDDA